MGILESLDEQDRAVLTTILARKAPDLLADLHAGKRLSAGPRERLEDVIDEVAVGYDISYGHADPRLLSVQHLLRSLARIQPREPEKLVTWGWKPGDPIHRGMDRYREIEAREE
ncbi:MAG: hypothetical protein FWE61_09935 [Micrococcales bacterium]|nr:hypothetical protein [Micrococcales bacterium]